LTPDERRLDLVLRARELVGVDGVALEPLQLVEEAPLERVEVGAFGGRADSQKRFGSTEP
jgi:hypothetical protein